MSADKRVLVVGGAGYIGSHMVKCLLQAGYQVVVLDDLGAGHRDAVPAGVLVAGPAGSRAVLDTLFQACPVAAIMHFAGDIQVGESVQRPLKYYANNLGATITLLEAALAHGVQSFIFSSTAAIFGAPQYTPIDEAHPAAPINPYGRSKWMVEQVLADASSAHGLRSVCLRYFNAAGADPEGQLGERHSPETHLIPLLLQVASGRRASLSLFGDDYPTPDGTCVRDYIHVSDLCEAHLLALRYLEGGGASARFNLGNGAGYSNREVLAAVRRVTGRPVPVTIGPRRPGDPPILVAESRLARATLGWAPRWPDIDAIIAHAWAWEQKQGGQPGH
ncbi:UDP-glucose 4-epimerase GalE [Massilia sp. TS11]|uniref:UDP-glucose 4-epimerase GalE n=1 Tax=Massilia sp. TS11 TaxID=2908003 RepID=UPI001EDA6442|nr:UDP-glucose 4-epimerase GalE [Massilia sp. TS11]MCG2584313.1 UDP-glucose 4-epimerase GalE [Massilia sp. TS11]